MSRIIFGFGEIPPMFEKSVHVESSFPLKFYEWNYFVSSVWGVCIKAEVFEMSALVVWKFLHNYATLSSKFLNRASWFFCTAHHRGLIQMFSLLFSCVVHHKCLLLMNYFQLLYVFVVNSIPVSFLLHLIFASSFKCLCVDLNFTIPVVLVMMLLLVKLKWIIKNLYLDLFSIL